ARREERGAHHEAGAARPGQDSRGTGERPGGEPGEDRRREGGVVEVDRGEDHDLIRESAERIAVAGGDEMDAAHRREHHRCENEQRREAAAEGFLQREEPSQSDETVEGEPRRRERGRKGALLEEKRDRHQDRRHGMKFPGEPDGARVRKKPQAERDDGPDGEQQEGLDQADVHATSDVSTEERQNWSVGWTWPNPSWSALAGATSWTSTSADASGPRAVRRTPARSRPRTRRPASSAAARANAPWVAATGAVTLRGPLTAS